MKKTFWYTVYCFVFIASILLSQNKPDDYGELFIKAVNSDSETEQKEIISKIFSKSTLNETGIDRLLAFVKKMHSEYAPLTYHHSEVLSFDMLEGKSYILHLFAKKKDDVRWKDFQWRLDAAPPHKLNTIGFIADVSEPVSLPNGSIEQKSTLDWLDNYIKTLNNEYDLYGSILIAKGNDIIFEKYFGFENPFKKIPVTDKTLFNIASGGKMFTALCIAKLVEMKKLGYDDKITQYLNGFTDNSKADKITIHHLLSHTSGVAEYWSGQNDKAFYSAKNLNDHLRLVYKSGFDVDAGTVYQYCNSNFILLGAIIEKVTGKTFFDVVQEFIFNPADMKTSGYFNQTEKNLALPLIRNSDNGEWVEPVQRNKESKGTSAGGAYSNAKEILKFSLALKNNQIVSRNTFLNMISAKNKSVKEPMDFDYGYGFILSRSGQETSYGHGGTAGGVNFEFQYFPSSDITLVLFCNQNNGAYDDLKKNAIKLITGMR